MAPGVSAQGFEVTFERVASEPVVGGSLLALGAGDLDQDGKLDLVTADADGESLAVLFGNGDGTFVEPPSLFSLEESAGPRAIQLADLDGNGSLDVAVANEVSNTVTVLLNGGDGVLARPRPFSVGESPTALASGDVNNDGRIDLVVANELDSTVSVLINQGSGTFSVGAPMDVGQGPAAVALADLNRDSHLDLIVASLDSGEALVGSVQVFLGQGDGTFLFHTELEGEMIDSPVSVIARDANGDGLADLVVLNQDLDDIAVFLQRSGGQYEWLGSFPVAIQPNQMVAADFNRDGRFDLAVSGEFEDKVSVLLGVGDGTFAVKLDFDVGPAPFALAVGDVDRDRLDDIAVTSQDAESITLLLNRTSLPAVCPGDCNRDQEVTVDEIVRMVNVALGNAEVAQCQAGDANSDGEITIDEIVRAVNAALSGCHVS